MKLNNFEFDKVSVIVKTLKDYEKVAAQIIKENFPEADVLANPLNFSGLILVKVAGAPEEIAEKIKAKIPEVEKAFPVMQYTCAKLDSIAKSALELKNFLRDAKSFAVRTVRRGKHDFSSIDVNFKVGSLLKEATGCQVNLDFPEKVVFVEILGPHVYLGVVDGKEFPKKMGKGKFEVREYFGKVSLVQMPYLGDLKVAREMGNRIGREVQTFEVGELVIAPIGSIDAKQLGAFLNGVFEGIKSRYQIQARTYAKKPRQTKVSLQNLYELVRERFSEPIIVFEPEGEPINKVTEQLAELTIKNERINFLIGSREGIPHGIFRFATLVVDLCPGVTIATDLAAASALTALAFALHKKLCEEAVKN
ncbi:RNA-binding protein [Candidatus Bathyarchaeota archaeon]|nr:MAG: RNA-binding protein [Candidatus Bathyarchaeota archaeon]